MLAGGNTVLVIHGELKMVNGRDGFVQQFWMGRDVGLRCEGLKDSGWMVRGFK